MERIICLLTGYVFGLFQTGYIYGKLHHVDIRTMGSGNSGATNVMRVFGAKAGLAVFLGDFLKAVLALLAVRVMFLTGLLSGGEDPSVVQHLYFGYAGLGVALGHNYPATLQFRGGKGVSSTAGILLMMDWKLMLVCLLTFIIIVFFTRYVSLGSIVGMILVFCGWVVSGQTGAWPSLSRPARLESYILMFFLTGLSIFRHRSNVGRLLNGTENKISFGSRKTA